MKNTLSISFSIIGIGGLISAILFSFSACNHAANNFASHDNNNVSIIIQPYNDMPKEYRHFVYSELSKVYSNLKINKPIAMPHTAWYEPKARYRADSLIRILSRSAGNNTVIIGLTLKILVTQITILLTMELWDLDFVRERRASFPRLGCAKKM